jgi:hypothetical protein
MDTVALGGQCGQRTFSLLLCVISWDTSSSEGPAGRQALLPCPDMAVSMKPSHMLERTMPVSKPVSPGQSVIAYMVSTQSTALGCKAWGRIWGVMHAIRKAASIVQLYSSNFSNRAHRHWSCASALE